MHHVTKFVSVIIYVSPKGRLDFPSGPYFSLCDPFSLLMMVSNEHLCSCLSEPIASCIILQLFVLQFSNLLCCLCENWKFYCWSHLNLKSVTYLYDRHYQCFFWVRKSTSGWRKADKASLAGGHTRLVGKVVCFKYGKLSRKFIFSLQRLFWREKVFCCRCTSCGSPSKGASFEVLEVKFKTGM